MTLFVRSNVRILILLIAVQSLSAADRDWSRVVGLGSRSVVRVRTADGAARRGELQSSDVEWIRLSEGGQPVSINRNDVRRVEVRTPSRRARNVVIGTLIGLGVGIVTAFATCPSCVGETSADEQNKRYATGAVVGAAAGAALGLTGSVYKTVYKAK